MSSFGPQTANLSTTRPATTAQVTASDTWFVDCSAAGAKDGTVIDASFLNVIIANLRTLTSLAGVTQDDGDSMIHDSVVALATSTIAGVFSGTKGITLNGTAFELALGQGTQTVLVSGTLDPVADLMQVYDASGTAYTESTIYNAVKSVLLPSSAGVTFNDTAGTITIAGITQTSAVTAPASPSLGDEWYDTANDRFYKRMNDGTSDVWREI